GHTTRRARADPDSGGVRRGDHAGQIRRRGPGCPGAGGLALRRGRPAPRGRHLLRHLDGPGRGGRAERAQRALSDRDGHLPHAHPERDDLRRCHDRDTVQADRGAGGPGRRADRPRPGPGQLLHPARERAGEQREPVQVRRRQARRDQGGPGDGAERPVAGAAPGRRGQSPPGIPGRAAGGRGDGRHLQRREGRPVDEGRLADLLRRRRGAPTV
ncbi:MAG: CBM66, partial [uncultured Solirubrobacteraceae bacterium]